MAIKGIISPTIEENVEYLDLAASEQQAPEVGATDLIKAAGYESWINNTGYSLGAWAYGKGSPNISQKELEEIYPNTPKDYWKGGANSFQAELLYDRFKAAQETEQLKNFIAQTTNPQSGGMAALGVDLIGSVGTIGGGLLDPMNVVANRVAKFAAISAGQQVNKIAPGFMKAVGNSRFGPIANEFLENLAVDAGITYGLNKGFLNEYDKQERGFKDAVVNSFGTTLGFTILKSVGGAALRKIMRSPVEFMDYARERSFSKSKDRANAATNSEHANNRMYIEAMEDAATSSRRAGSQAPDAPDASSSDRVASKVFTTKVEPKFEGTAPLYAVSERNSGSTDYPGERFGNTTVMVNSPIAAQGIFDLFANGADYTIQGFKGTPNLVDLETMPANEFSDIVDIIEGEMGSRVLRDLDDDSSLADLFRAANDMSYADGPSGTDVVAMFDDVNNLLKKAGYQGTIHAEQKGTTKHSVVSIFEGVIKQEDLTELKVGRTDTKDVMSNPAETDPDSGPIKTTNGSIIEATDKVDYDEFYDEDPDFIADLAKYNDPEYLKRVQEYELNNLDVGFVTKVLDDYIVEIEGDVKETKRQLESGLTELYHGTNTNFKEIDYSRGGGMAFFAEDAGTAKRYAQGAGGGRAPVPDSELIITDNFTNETLTLKGNVWSDSLGNTLSNNEVNKGLQDGTFSAEPTTQIIKKTKIDMRKVLDVTTKEGLVVLQGLLKGNDKLINSFSRSISNELKNEPGSPGFNYTFWTTTKNARVPETNNSLLKFSKILSDSGYKGMKFRDDSHTSIAVFDPQNSVGSNPSIDSLAQVEKQLKIISEGMRNNTPEKELEVVKAMENCLRKL